MSDCAAQVQSQVEAFTGTIEVTIKVKGKGQQGLLVTAVHTDDLGPFRVEGELCTVTKEVTNADGVALFEHLRFGNWGIRVDGLPSVEVGTAFGNFVVPDGNPVTGASDFGALIAEAQKGKVVLEPATSDEYESNLVNPTDPLITLTAKKPDAAVTLGSIARVALSTTFVDLLGNGVAADAWIIVPYVGEDLPWGGDFDFEPRRPGTTPGIVISTAAAGEGGLAQFQGLPPGIDVALEAFATQPPQPSPEPSIQSEDLPSIALTASRRFNTDRVTDNEIEVVPLVCEVIEKSATLGTVQSGIDIGPTVFDGTRSTPVVTGEKSGELDPELAVAIWFDFTGTGSEKLHARIETASGTDNLTMDWSWDGTACSKGAAKGPAADQGVTVRLFCRNNDDDDDSARATFSIDNLPADTEKVEYSFMDFPDPAKTGADVSDAFSFIEIVADDGTCTNSNDPPFSMIT